MRSLISQLPLAIARLATRRPRLVVGGWIVVVVLLGLVGRDLDRKLAIHPLYIDGTASKRAHEIAEREFGDSYTLIVMLRGPGGAVDSQGRELTAQFEAQRHMLVISPWTGNEKVKGLRPSPGTAALVVRIESSEDESVPAVLPPVRRLVDRSVGDPVRANIAGFPVVAEALRNASDDAAKTGEMIAAPVLLIILLLVFRSVLAAIAPIVIGGSVVIATTGVLAILHNFIALDLFALGVVGMMGLALGVDYSLLVISRFREERRHRDLGPAVEAAVLATTRSVVPAGCGFILAMVVAAFILPGVAARSGSIAVIAATVPSMLAAICVVPALLMLLGDNLDRWSLPVRSPIRVSPVRRLRRLADRPGVVAGIFVVLVLLASLSFKLDTDIANIALLPSADAARKGQEDVEKALGPGWTAPMEVIVNGRGKPITSIKRLRALASFQRRVEDDPGVATMAGFRQAARGAEQVAGIEGELHKQEEGLDRLVGGIAKAHLGATRTTEGLGTAAAGSSKLKAGLGAANGGAGALGAGLRAVSDGSRRLNAGLGRVDEGSGKLAEGTAKASTGAGRLADALSQAEEKADAQSGSTRLLRNAMQTGEERLDEVRAPLSATEGSLNAAYKTLQRMSVGRSDPEYAAALEAVEEASRHLTGEEPGGAESSGPSSQGVGSGVERADGQFGVGLYLVSQLDKNSRQANKGIEKLARASAQLDRGLRGLATGSERVSGGIDALARGGERLAPGLVRLGDGAEHLSAGLGLLEAGAGRLSAGLGSGAEKSKLLGAGLKRIGSGLEGQDGSGLAQLKRSSPGIFRSPDFILAALDGSPSRQRRQLTSLISIDHGGMYGRMLVVPREGSASDGTRATKDRLEDDAEQLARETGAEVVVGGIAPTTIDANAAVRELSPLLRLALSIVTLLILIPLMRSLSIPLLAVLINLLTVSASFGVLALLFDGSFLGGPGYIDATVVLATMMIMFGLAIDYEVFVFARIREEYVRTGSTREAVRGGLDRTAHVVTGAAMIMISVFLAFAVSDYMTIRNFGVAQAVAVFIDAFIVRLIIVPAVMNRLGSRCWWIPKWLERMLPSERPRARDQAKAEPAGSHPAG